MAMLHCHTRSKIAYKKTICICQRNPPIQRFHNIGAQYNPFASFLAWIDGMLGIGDLYGIIVIIRVWNKKISPGEHWTMTRTDVSTGIIIQHKEKNGKCLIPDDIDWRREHCMSVNVLYACHSVGWNVKRLQKNAIKWGNNYFIDMNSNEWQQ